MNTGKINKSKEIWKSPPSLNKWWVEVSNLGRVRTLDHESTFTRFSKKQCRISYGRIKKLSKDTRGRYQVEIDKKMKLVH